MDTPLSSSSVGQRIKKLREKLSMSQAEFADRVGMTASLVSQWERDTKRPSMKAAYAISKEFAVSIDYIFGRTPAKELFLDEQVISFLNDYMRLKPKERLFIQGVVRGLKKLRSKDGK